VEGSRGEEIVTPEQYARDYLEKYGMIPGYDFVPSTAISAAAKLYTDFVDDDLGLDSKEEPKIPLKIDRRRIDWFGDKL
jgi:hypothetical protein